MISNERLLELKRTSNKLHCIPTNDIIVFSQLFIRHKYLDAYNKSFLGFTPIQFKEYLKPKIHCRLVLQNSAYTTREEFPDLQYIFDLGLQALSQGQTLKQ